MLLDLNGFKLYNDTFGHPAGDALLARISDHLTRAVNGRGKAYRMGGDEFCVLSRTEAGAASEPVATTIAAALTERGEGFSIDASYGWVILPREASEPGHALRIVDQRMYTQKEGGHVSARAQSKNVLVQALLERSPDLTEHLSAVSRWRSPRVDGSDSARPSSRPSRWQARCTTSARSRSPTRSSTRGPAQRRGVAVRQASLDRRRADRRCRSRPRGRCQDRSLGARASRRRRISGSARRRRDPTRLAHSRRRRCVPRHDVRRPSLPFGESTRRARSPSSAVRGHPVRRGGRRSVSLHPVARRRGLVRPASTPEPSPLPTELVGTAKARSADSHNVSDDRAGLEPAQPLPEADVHRSRLRACRHLSCGRLLSIWLSCGCMYRSPGFASSSGWRCCPCSGSGSSAA